MKIMSKLNVLPYILLIVFSFVFFMACSDSENDSPSTIEDENVSPTVDISANPITGTAPLSVTLDGSGSTDSDGTIVSYAWDFGDDTQGTGAQTSNTFISPGTYTIALTITDNDGASDSDSITVQVNKQDYTSEGWTEIVPSADTQIVYVSSSQGNDDNDGSSPENPVRSLSRGAELVRDGYPDHLLLRRGDVWTGEDLYIFKSGRNVDERMVISYYGETGGRPLVRIDRSFINHNGRARSNLAIIGISFIAYKMDPSDPGFDIAHGDHIALRFVGGGDNILIEDCRFQFAEIVVQNWDGNIYRNIQLRRSIVIDTWAPNTTTSHAFRPSGIYADGIDALLIEECVFDHNGWNETVPGAGANMYNHNMYIQYSNVGNTVVVRNNIVTRASSHGVHGRPGGLYEDNLFARNSIGLQMGYNNHPLPAGTFARARNNVIIHGKRMDPDNFAWPRNTAVWGLALDDLGEGSVTVEGNIVANRDDSGSELGLFDFAGVTYIENIQHNWGGGIGDMDDSSWLDPNRDVASYHGTLGGVASLEAFLEVVRNRPLRTWSDEYSAHAVNEYIREGFL